MVAVKPVQFNNTASSMVMSVVGGSLAKDFYISNFLKQANSTKTQGKALIDYYTAVNDLKADIFSFSRKEREQLSKLSDIYTMLDESVHSFPDLQMEADKFTDALNKNYPKSLATRLALAEKGYVDSYNVKKYSHIGKLWKRFKVIVGRTLIAEG